MVQRCAYCGELRSWVDSYVMGGHVGAGKVGKPPASMVRVGDLAPIGRLLDAMASERELGFGRARVFVHYVTTGRSADSVALEVSDAGVGGRHWSSDDVRRAVRQCRAWMERRLQAAGLLLPRQFKPRSKGAMCRTSDG